MVKNNFVKRNFECMLEDICALEKISYRVFGDGWIYRLEKGNKIKYTYGYSLPINGGNESKICDDKAATSQLLKENNISCFEHVYFLNNSFNKKDVEATFKKFNNNVVIKPNNGTGGIDVFHLTNKTEFIKCFNKQIVLNKAIAISPYYDYEFEYRLIMLGDKCKISFRKNKTNDWKHNLGLGAIPTPINDKVLFNRLLTLSKKVIKRMNMKFCSVDIAVVKGKLIVVEVNAGVMTESYSKIDKEHYDTAFEMYHEAIKQIF